MATSAMPGSDRLLFEPLQAEHAVGLFGPLSDPRVHEHIGRAPPPSVAALAERFAFIAGGPPADRPEQRWVNYAVRLREGGLLIGRLEATLVDGRAEVAYLFDPRHWGCGYATEAMSAFQDHLRQDWGVVEFWATTVPENTRSVRLLERLGYARAHPPWPPLLTCDPGDLVFVRGTSCSR